MIKSRTNVEFGVCRLKLLRDIEDGLIEKSALPAEKSASEDERLLDEDGIRSGSLYFDEHKIDGKHLPFMMCPYSVKPQDVVTKFKHEWRLPMPRIVLFVIAGSSESPPEKYIKLSSKLVKGLVYALNTTEMWLCSDGLNHSFSKDIGAAFENELTRRMNFQGTAPADITSAIPERALIGICRQDSLLISDQLGMNKVILRGKEDEYFEVKKDVNRCFDYFIFIKDTTNRKTGLAKFLLNFANYMSKHLRVKRRTLTTVQHDRFAERYIETPVMILLLHGKISDLDLVLGHIKNRLPVVVLEGSGGLADVLAYAYYQAASLPEGINIAEHTETVLKPQIMEKMYRIYPDLSEFHISEKVFTEKIFDCIRSSKQNEQEYITVLNHRDIERDPSCLSCFLLRALFKSHASDLVKDSKELKKDLFLAMDWNSADVAMAEVFARDRIGKFEIDSETFFRALIKPQREEFVLLFLRQGFIIHTFLDCDTLLELFQNSMNTEFFRTIVWETVLGFSTNVEITRRFLDTSLVTLIEELTGIPAFLDSYMLDWNCRGIYDDRTPKQAERKAIAVLVIWAILSYRVQLAKVLWSQSQQPIHLALVCSIILRKLEPFVTDLSLRNEMEKHSKEFNKMATGVMTKCYDRVPCRALDLLREKNRNWSYKALVEMAAYAKNRMFLAHPACQKYLDNLFMGFIKVHDLPFGDVTVPLWLKIILSAFLIFPMYFWIRFDIPQEYSKASSKKTSVSDKPHESVSEESKSKSRAQRKFHAFTNKVYYLWSAPITKFWVSQVFYILFLFCFSLAVMWPACGSLYLDFVTCFWTATIIIDSTYHTYTLNKEYSSIPSVFKCIEISFMMLFFFLYIIGRITPQRNLMPPYNAKIILCLALVYFYYRLIFIALPISSQLGPMLYRVKRMVVVDFSNYIRVTILVIISNGLVIHATLYPDYPLSWELIRRALYDSVLNLFLVPSAEAFGTAESICVKLKRHANKRSFMGLPPDTCKVGMYVRDICPNPGVWPYLFGMQYLIILRLILNTMLFALFSNTQTILHNEGMHIWKYQRYELIVNFANRITLPPPLCLFTFIYMLIQQLYRYTRRVHKDEVEDNLVLDENDFGYWKSLASECYKENAEDESSETSVHTRMKRMKTLTEALNLQRKMLRDLQGSLLELQIHMNNAHQHLKESRLQASGKERLDAKHVPQIFSRISPYPNTMISRFPVSDHHVPWQSEWASYDPIVFTLPKEHFPKSLRPHLDVDIQMKREIEGEKFKMPLFKWNTTSVSPGGVYLDRQSWITDKSDQPFQYEFDHENLPKNPMGRTGLRGRGCLPRWGPNHFMYVAITRWEEIDETSFHKYLDLVVLQDGPDISLPGGYVSTENKYETIRSLFESNGVWWEPQDMIAFFESLKQAPKEKRRLSLRRASQTSVSKLSTVDDFQHDRVKRGYLDEETNTDQAWCEAEVWHFHYNTPCSVEEKFKSDMKWTSLNEDVLLKLPIGQASVVHTIAKKMKAVLEVM